MVETLSRPTEKETERQLQEQRLEECLERGGREDIVNIIDTLDSYKPLTHRDIALKLIEAGQGYAVAVYLSNFEGLDHRDIALKLIEAGEGRAVAEFLSEFGGLDSIVALKLIEAGEGRAVAKYLSNFEGLDSIVALKLIEAGEGYAVAVYLPSFEGLDHRDIALKLIEAGEGYAVAKHLSSFEGLDHRDIALKLFEAGQGRAVAVHLSNFEGLDHREIALRLIEAGEGRAVAVYLSNFEGLDHREIALRLIEAREGWTVAEHLSNFEGLDHRDIALKLIETGWGEAVAVYLSNFEGLDSTVALKLFEAGEGRAVARYLPSFEGLDSTVALKLIEAGEGRQVIKHHQSFSLSRDDAEQVYKFAFNVVHLFDLQDLHAFSEAYHPVLDRTLGRYMQMFALFPSHRLFAVYQGLLEGTVTPDAEDFGITATGDKGIQQLREKINELKQQLFSDNEEYPNTELARELVMHYTRYENSSWGSTTSESFDSIVRHYHSEDHTPLKAYFTPSEPLPIKKLTTEEHAPQLTEDVINRFTTVKDAICAAQQIVKTEKKPLKPLTHITNIIEQGKQETIAVTEEKLATTTNAKAQEHMQRKIERLQNTNVRSIKEFQENFTFLADFRTLRTPLMIAMFIMTFMKRKNQINESWDTITHDTDGVSKVCDFVNHITNQEVMAQYFTDKKAKKRFEEVINVATLEQGIARLTDRDTQGTAAITCIPTRNLLTELSGHIADACWADKYDSVLNTFDNLTSLIFVQNQDTPHERIAGATLLFEAEADDGTPLLIIRGLNPQENIINTLSAEDFYTQITDYLTTIAKKDNRTLAITIDDHTGGSATNRPTLFNYLTQQKEHLTPVTLQDPSSVTFNGYDLSGEVYYVS